MKWNPFLAPMVTLGIVAFLGGGIVVVAALTVLKSAGTSGEFVAWSIAVAAAPFLSGFGLMLLLIAWIIAAAKWQRD